jgi:fibronectin type 3 domain-containing protein
VKKQPPQGDGVRATPGTAGQARRLGWVILGLLCCAGCAKDHALDTVRNERDPRFSGISPPVPTELRATISSRTVELTWTLADSSHADAVANYRIYVASPVEREALADSTAAPPALVSSLDNGVLYQFRVTSVLDNGLEGLATGSITASPASFGLVIDSDREKTNQLDVALSLQAPGGTQGLKLSNLSDLTDVPVRPFVETSSWTLTPGDGEKTVYAQFVDPNGNLSRIVSDRIVLDTRAEILSVSFTPSSAEPGEILHLRLDAGEPYSTGEIRLGSGGPLVELRDDGQGGDAAAADGVYELDYTIEADLELFEELVTGFFTDQAGNQAASKTAAGRLTVHQDPQPVVLASPSSPGPQELRLEWSQAPDANRFQAYHLLRDETPGVATSPTRVELRVATSRGETDYTDRDLDPQRTYYYVVLVEDGFGNTVASNEVSGRPQQNEPPDPVVLNPPTSVDERSISLSFSRSFAPDFASYRIYRGFQADLESDPDRRLLTTITSITQTNYEDVTEIEENRTYYYEVAVVDALGAVANSNVVSATTPDKLPAPVELQQPGAIGETSVLLTWTPNADLDFEQYEVRRADQAGVDAGDPLLVTIDRQEETSYLDQGLVENTDYYYRVFVLDRGGNRSGSNELKLTTANADPAAVTLSRPTQPDPDLPEVVLDWTGSSAHDFAEYRLYRDTSPAVSEAADLVRAIVDPQITTFTNSGLLDNTRYYYRVFVRDDADGATGSNEQSIVTANQPPQASVLTVSATTPTSISLSWTRNDDHDFLKYQLWRGTSENLTIIAAEFTQRSQTGHTVFIPAGDTTVYFFMVRVIDQDLDSSQGLSTDSNIVSAQTTGG